MRDRSLALSCIAVLALVISQVCCEFAPRDIRSLDGSGRVYFVTLGEFPRTLQDALAEHYRKKYNLEIQMLSTIKMDMASFDVQRQQLIAEEAIRLMRSDFPDLAADPKAILIGLTTQDMYIRNKTWRFAFSYREGERFAVVSSGRMHIGLSAAESIVFQTRVRKMVTKNIGILYYHLPISVYRQSVLYGNVGGIEELDGMGEEF
ncbi:MAG TPA: hypothetical protein VE222_00690 [Nitrospiraceae bacterium]|jgi:predicted Zn-dependent protease|nr:hypothetical protein [Nitrospiraceae bacterium]